MACSENIKDLLPDYHLGQLPPGEADEVRRHLQEDEECQEHLREVAEMLDLMPLAVEPVQPPAHLKERVLERVREDASRRNRTAPEPAAVPDAPPSGRWSYRRMLPALAAAAMVLVAFAGLAWSYLGLQEENRQLQAEVQELQEDVRGLRGEGLVAVPVEGTGEAPGARGTAVVDPGEGSLALNVYNLPAAPEGHSYRAWLVGAEGQNLSLGPMELDERGDGRMTGQVSEPLADYEALELTIEPEGAEEMGGPVYLQADL